MVSATPTNPYIGVQTKRLSLVMRTEHTPSFRDIHREVDQCLKSPNFQVARGAGKALWSGITNGIGALFGKTPVYTELVFPGGHTFNVESAEAEKNLVSEFARISKLSDFEKKCTVFIESAVLFVKAWAAKILAFFSRKI